MCLDECANWVAKHDTDAEKYLKKSKPGFIIINLKPGFITINLKPGLIDINLKPGLIDINLKPGFSTSYPIFHQLMTEPHRYDVEYRMVPRFSLCIERINQNRPTILDFVLFSKANFARKI